MDFEFCYYYVDDNQERKYGTIEEARAAAKELSKELHYYPSIKFVALVIDQPQEVKMDNIIEYFTSRGFDVELLEDNNYRLSRGGLSAIYLIDAAGEHLEQRLEYHIKSFEQIEHIAQMQSKKK